MEKTTQDILNEAAILLSEEGRWIKGQFFASNPDGKGCAMCAHGAIAYCGDQAIRTLVEENKLAMAGDRAYSSDKDSYLGGDVSMQKANLRQAHANANKVGLDYSYNDSPHTTKEQVIDKLHEAATL